MSGGLGLLDTYSKTAWISQGFERLIDRVRKAPTAIHFDILIIGSGYGGAIAAATFAGRQSGGAAVAVGVLERGKEYLPGSFPTGLGELPGHIRQNNNKEGLFDIRLGEEVTTVVANGVGGGSLINAGVMQVPTPSVFQTGWPSSLEDLSIWESHFDRARDLLGASINGLRNTIVDHIDGVPQKFQAFRAIAPTGTFHPAAITIAMKDSTSSGNVNLNKCVRCGDCATGCNFGAKNSLDINLLVRAQQSGAEIFSGATVLSIEKNGSTGWIVNSVHTNAALRKRGGEVLKIRARKVVLAAGTLGSTEILLRSRDLGLPISEALGKRCSTNGDMLIADYATAAAVHTVADETVKPSNRAIGPTITGVVDLRATDGVVIEEMSVPAGLRIAFTEVFATVNALHGLAEADSSQHVRGFPSNDLYVAPATRVEHSALYAVMGDDGAAGSIELDDDPEIAHPDGMARLRWDKLQDLPVFDAQVETLAALTENTGGRVIPNPVWKLLPAELTWLLKDKRGPLTTVHPLGGCSMADTGATGVVDHIGRVFSTNVSDAVHDGLVVLDGSIIPTALGTNPALTISAVALRAAEALAIEWGYAVGPSPAAGAPLTRPSFRLTDVAAQPPATEVEIIERLAGPVNFAPSGGPAATRIVELTLRFSSAGLAQLTPSNGGNPTLQVATDTGDFKVRSSIRIFPLDKWERLQKSWTPPRLLEQELDAIADFSAPLTGSLRIFERQHSSAFGRIWRAGKAWLLNRGLRDIYQAIVDGDGGPGLLSRIKSGLAIASRSGEIRAFAYDLTVGPPDAGAKIALDGNHIVGTKTFTYERRCSPWRQLMEVALETFPGSSGTDKGVLKLDVRYLARIGVPLFRITQQRNGVSALGDLVTFLGYVVRLLLGLHIWSFRAPDKDTDPANDVLNLLPPTTLALPGGGSVAAEIRQIPIAAEEPEGGDGGVLVPGKVRLTRYPNPGTSKRPLVMLHGYSAGGTTFAHHAVNPNFASHFWKTGRDVWIADLRTSSGHPTTAKEAWSFDQIGSVDVPAVLRTVAAESIDGKVDVIAHCMGTVVFSIAILGGHVDNSLVDRAAFTQVGPLVVFSPANVFRAYAMRYLIDFLPDSYSFNPENPTLADDLWDRLLSTLPYPVEEFDVENPIWPWKRTPWTRTRHRMDALYGRDFNVRNMEPEMLRFIDEHFGTLSLKTVSSTVHFARYALMTNFRGYNNLVSREKFFTRWTFPTLSVHGGDNGLSDVSTVDRIRQILSDAGCDYEAFINPGAGHQDALVGTTRYATLTRIEEFLDAAIAPSQNTPNQAKVAYPPWMGPIITEERQRPGTLALVVRVGALPSLRAAEAVLMLRITSVGNQILRPDDPAKKWDTQYIVDHMAVYTANELAQDRWAAFEAPLPISMPNHDPAHPGNALLVLLVYSESEMLFIPMLGHFFARNERVFRLNPAGPPDDPAVPAEEFKFEQFKRMAEAAGRALEPYNVEQRDGAQSTPRRLIYRGMEQIPNSTRNIPMQPDISDGTTTSMMFGYEADGEAVLERIEQDRDLTDGIVPYDPQPPTIPSPSSTSFTLASCQYPAGFIDEPVAYRSYHRIVERLEANAGIKPRFSIFVGDQVYVDPTAGLYDPAAKADRYRLPYEAWLRQRSVRGVLRRIPSFMLLDDHEIDDNWEPIASPDQKPNDDKKKYGAEAFKKYQRGRKGGLETFDFDGFHFFMLDTRTERMHRKVDGNLANATLFDTDQADLSKTMGRLQKWLLDKPAPKFVVSPAMLLPRHRRAVQRDASLDPSNLSALHSDGWDGYPNTLRDVLAYIAQEKIKGVVFLSGDEHRGCVATVELRDTSDTLITRVHSLHTAAAYSPFPFANSLDEDIVADETIDIVSNYGNYRCVVNATRPPPGDGVTFLSVRQDGTAWKLDYEFADGTVQTLVL
ncbi:alpha/beta fold hydrolase [Bradyrhizobium sp. 157]|uniref:alkaline phosphatase D family protein n=1 Tax=Bradyrhizobium sp. 157 TaxID=2782631 RepID=UPI001FF7B9CB|nr:alkaline phosphatase D family protein [Bradyrhizobium sp. 157]MCK1642954.1 alpha/beta fold hydrolase [Bradyrhizobium sp. 157]